MATIYVSPLGSGNGSGSSAANAKPFGELNGAIKAAGPGGTVLLLADQGNYTNASGLISLTAGGLPGAPVTLKGVSSSGNAMDIQIHGTRSPDYSPGMTTVGNNVIRLLDGASNLTFEGFDFYNVQCAFTLGANIQNITIQNMEGNNVRYFVNNNAVATGATATVSGLTVRDVEVHGFSKSVVHLQYNTNNVVIDNVYGDSEYQDGDQYAMGVMLDGTVHDVVVKNSTMLNCIATSATGDFWNGDGFVTERGVYNVRFENTRAAGNGDSGYDLKSNGTVLVNAIAEDNARNFRLWDQAQLIDCIGIDPHKRGGSGAQIQINILNGADVTVTGGHFVDSGSATKVVFNDSTGRVAFNGTDFVHASDSTLLFGRSPMSGVNMGLVQSVAATGIYSTNGEIYLGGGGGPAPAPSPTSPTEKSLTGTAGNDVLAPTTADHWTVTAADGADKITTLGGNDTLIGGRGNDTLSAGAGDDTLRGCAGADILTGGAGSDFFDFNAIGDSKGSTRDRIIDFAQGSDKIDLSGIDAVSGVTGNQGFQFVGEAGFSKKAGELRVDHTDPTKTIVTGDVNGDGIADFTIELSGNISLTGSDFIL